MYDVIVIGAGIAGISAAMQLAKHGKRVLVLEQNSSPGGRFYSFKDHHTGEIIDNGQHLMTGAYSNFLSIANDLGTSQFLTMQKYLGIDFFSSNGKHDKLDCSMLPGKAGVLLGLLRMKNLTSESKFAIAKLFIKINSLDLSKNDIPVNEFLRRERQPDNSVYYFWEPLTLATLNNSIENSSANLLVTVLKRAFFSGKDNSKLIFPNSPLSDILSPFPEWLSKHGGKAVFNEKMIGINIYDNRISSVTTPNHKYSADNYIFAIPPNKLYNILDNKYKRLPEFSKLKDIEYSPIVSVYLWLDAEFPDIKFAAMLGTKSHWVFNRKNILSENNNRFGASLTVTISNASGIIDLPKKKIAELCFNELKELFPEIKKSIILHSVVVKMKYATILQTPKSILSLPNAITPIKNMYMAGDHINTGLPATIEGAALSGKIAAGLISENQTS
jgi:hydroxysqualene dehydroxylase